MIDNTSALEEEPSFPITDITHDYNETMNDEEIIETYKEINNRVDVAEENLTQVDRVTDEDNVMDKVDNKYSSSYDDESGFSYPRWMNQMTLKIKISPWYATHNLHSLHTYPTWIYQSWI